MEAFSNNIIFVNRCLSKMKICDSLCTKRFVILELAIVGKRKIGSSYIWKLAIWRMQFRISEIIKLCEDWHHKMMKIPVHNSSKSWI